MVQGDVMKNVEQEKYLRDQIHRNRKQHPTTVERLLKSFGILANILALIQSTNKEKGQISCFHRIETKTVWP